MSTDNSNLQLLMPYTKGKNKNKKSTLLTRGSIVIKCIITGTYTLVYTSLNINNDKKDTFQISGRLTYSDNLTWEQERPDNWGSIVPMTFRKLWRWTSHQSRFSFFLKMSKDQGWFNSVWGEAPIFFYKKGGVGCVSILWRYVNKEGRQVWKIHLPISWRDIVYLQNLTSWVERLRSGI